MGINDRVAERQSVLEAQAASRAEQFREEYALNMDRALELRKNRRELLDLASRLAMSMSSAGIPEDVELVTRSVAYKKRFGVLGRLETQEQVTPLAIGWLLRKNATDKGVTTIIRSSFYLSDNKGAVLTPAGTLKLMDIPQVDKRPELYPGSEGIVIKRTDFTDFPSVDSFRFRPEATKLGATVSDHPDVWGRMGLFADIDSDTEHAFGPHFFQGERDFEDLRGVDSSLIDGLITLAAILTTSQFKSKKAVKS